MRYITSKLNAPLIAISATGLVLSSGKPRSCLYSGTEAIQPMHAVICPPDESPVTVILFLSIPYSSA